MKIQTETDMILGYDSPDIAEKSWHRFICFAGHIYGPPTYMYDRGFDLLERIRNGEDDEIIVILKFMVPRATINAQPDLEMAILKRLQDDFEDYIIGV